MKTGWYYVEKKKDARSYQLEKSTEQYFIDPTPIVLAKDFNTVELKSGDYGDYLLIKLNVQGTSRWSEATGNSIGKKLALIINDRLVYTPQVNAQITSGVAALNRGNFSKAELEIFKKLILENK